MAGFGLLIGGAMKGYGDNVLERAKAQREQALKELEEARQDRRLQSQQDFASREAEIGRNFEAGENEKNRAIKVQEASIEKPTDDMREYAEAVKQGFEGTFMDYQVKMKEAGRNQVNIDTGAKLPAGFRWKDPKDQDLGVEPIPGGPGEQIPAELAARIGLAKDAMTKLDAVEEAAKDGKMTGVIDWAAGKAGYGEAGVLRRELAAGAEALTRMLTGAGMNLAEVKREVDMYLPAIQDNADTLANKVSQLKRRLQSTVEMAGRGRGMETAQPSGQAPDAGTPPAGVDPDLWKVMTPEERALWN